MTNKSNQGRTFCFFDLFRYTCYRLGVAGYKKYLAKSAELALSRSQIFSPFGRSLPDKKTPILLKFTL